MIHSADAAFITCIAFHFNFVVTGSINGSIQIWDYSRSVKDSLLWAIDTTPNDLTPHAVAPPILVCVFFWNGSGRMLFLAVVASSFSGSSEAMALPPDPPGIFERCVGVHVCWGWGGRWAWTVAIFESCCCLMSLAVSA